MARRRRLEWVLLVAAAGAAWAVGAYGAWDVGGRNLWALAGFGFLSLMYGLFAAGLGGSWPDYWRVDGKGERKMVAAFVANATIGVVFTITTLGMSFGIALPMNGVVALVGLPALTAVGLVALREARRRRHCAGGGG